MTTHACNGCGKTLNTGDCTGDRGTTVNPTRVYNGATTAIPIMVILFCPHCGYKNEVRQGGY